MSSARCVADRCRMVGDLVAFPVRLRSLIYRLAARELMARFKGSVLGIMWAVAGPALSVGVYAFVFGSIFQGRVGAGLEGAAFVAWLFVGVSTFALFADVIGRAPHLVTGNAAYVKKVIFPLHVIPFVTLLGSLPQYAVGMLIAAAMFVSVKGAGALVGLAVAVQVLVPVMLLIVGLAWMVSAVAVYIRDVAQLVNYALSLLIFLSPVFYPLDAVPEEIRGFVDWSPLAFAVESIRAGFIDGRFPAAADWFGYTGAALVVYFLGFACFSRLRHGFADFI